MKDKKLRISKDDLSDGEGGEDTGEKTMSIPANDGKDNGEDKSKEGGKADAGTEDEARGEKAPADKKAKKGFRPKLKSPLPGRGKGKKGLPKTKKSSSADVAAGTTDASPQDQHGFIRRQHPMVLVGTGIALFAVFFAGTFLLIDVLKTDRQRSEEALEYSTKAVIEVQEGIVRAQREELPYSFLQDLAKASGDLSGKVEGRRRSYEAEVTDKPELTEPTVAAMNADLRFLQSFAELATVKDEALGRRWRQIKRDLKSATRSLDQARPRVSSEISDDPTLLPTNTSLDRSVGSANRIVLTANTKLQAWFTELRRIRAQCERASGFIDIASSLVGEYRDQRSATDSALDAPGLPWDDAYDILSAEASRRDELASRFQAEQPPLLAQASWTQMGLLVRESASVLTSAADGISREPALFWPRSVTKPVFDSQSQDLSAEIDSTDATLQGDLAAAEEQACNQEKPSRPAV